MNTGLSSSGMETGQKGVLNTGRTQILRIIIVLCALYCTPAAAGAITFDWTGQFTVQTDVLAEDNIWYNYNGDPQTPVSGSFTFDPDNPDLSWMTVDVVPFGFLSTGDPDTQLTLLSMEEIDSTHLFGRFGIEWNADPALFGDNFQIYMLMGIVWDITGLRNAIDNAPGGLQVGDIISGNEVSRGGSVILGDIGSAIPATDYILLSDGSWLEQGPAPMATTTTNAIYDSILGNTYYVEDTINTDSIGGMPVIGVPYGNYASVNIDIGSGNSMIVTSVVPVPAAAWLFGSGLLGLIGVARRWKAA